MVFFTYLISSAMDPSSPWPFRGCMVQPLALQRLHGDLNHLNQSQHSMSLFVVSGDLLYCQGLQMSLQGTYNCFAVLFCGAVLRCCFADRRMLVLPCWTSPLRQIHQQSAATVSMALLLNHCSGRIVCIAYITHKQLPVLAS